MKNGEGKGVKVKAKQKYKRKVKHTLQSTMNELWRRSTAKENVEDGNDLCWTESLSNTRLLKQKQQSP